MLALATVVARFNLGAQARGTFSSYRYTDDGLLRNVPFSLFYVLSGQLSWHSRSSVSRAMLAVPSMKFSLAAQGAYTNEFWETVMETKVARPIVALLSVTLSLYGLYGCATASKDLTPTYASPMQYQGYDCDQIAAEIQRISSRVNQLGGRLDEAASNDKGITAVGIILFWPILFALGGTKQQEAEYSRLKGEYDALEQQAVLKKCSIVPRTTTATAVPGAAPISPAPGQVGSVATPVAATTAVPNPVPITAAPSVPGTNISPTSRSNIAAVGMSSRYMINAERLAKTSGCESPAATMNISAATYETFTILCAKREPMSIRCDDGNTCRALQ